MTQYILLIYSLMFITTSLFAQSSSSYKIEGEVFDTNKSPIEMGNIIVFSIKDSSLLKGNFFMDGKFELDGISESRILVKITALGYRDTVLAISNKENEAALIIPPTNLLPDLQLEEVTIQAKVPVFEAKAGKIVVNVANTILSESQDIEELLRKSPRVKVRNDVVEVMGKGTAVIYVDGKRVSLYIAKQIPVKEIVNMEIITNPSAKYDADVAAVINIITKNFHLIGSQLVVRNNIDYTLDYGQVKFEPTLTYNLKKEKYSIMMNYQTYTGTIVNEENFQIKSDLDFGNESFWKYKFHNKPGNFHENRLGTEFYLKNDQQISAQLTTNYDRTNFEMTNENTKISPILEDRFSDVTRSEISNVLWGQITLNYKNNLDTLGSNLFIGADLGQNSGNLNYNILETTGDYQEEILSTQKNKYQYMNYQLDYTRYLNESRYIEAGAKVIYGTSNNVVKLSSDENSGYNDLSSKAAYDENINAVYFQFSDEINKSSYTLGLRGEQAHTTNSGSGDDIKTMDTSLLNLFPTGSFSFRESATLSYSTSIRRPNYEAIGAASVYEGGNVFTIGNGRLKPTYRHSVELGLLEGYINISYLHAKNPFYEAMTASNDSANYFYNIQFNGKYLNQYRIDGYYDWEGDKFSISNWLGLSYFEADNFINSNSYENKISLNYWTRLDYRINKKLKLSSTFSYDSRVQAGFVEVGQMLFISPGIYYTSENKKLRINVLAENITNQQFSFWQSFTGTSMEDHYFTDSRYVRFVVSYKFGKLEAPTYSNESLEEDRSSGVEFR
ncbi:MAG: outer membrane beta-barrel protein [Flavobacteriales bacterium]|nr:outer membrane beta-barrel protein [Flavobacteriales bacterium]